MSINLFVGHGDDAIHLDPFRFFTRRSAGGGATVFFSFSHPHASIAPPRRAPEYFRHAHRVVRLNVEIENAREAQRGRYANGDGAGGGDVVRRVRSNLTNLASSSGSDHGVYRSSSKYDDGDNDNSGTPLAGRQRDALHRLQDVDAIEIDADLDEIHEGIKRLHELALRQGEEVRRHGDMLDVVDGRIDYSCVRTMKATSKVERFGRKV